MEQNKEKQSQSKSKGKKQTRQTREQRRQLEMILVGILILIVIIVIAVLVIHRRTYHNYSVLSSSKNENVQAYGFVQFEDEILKYGTDGVSLVNQKEETVWSEDFQMTNPTVDVCENMAVVADKDATSLYILSKEKVVGTVQTSKPILKARVARTGVVAAILQDNDKTWVDFYAKDGSLIAENQTRIDSPGYPVDIAVSPNGKIIMVSYLYVEDAQTTSYVAFYNFGDSGQSEIDNIVSGYTYKDVIVPQTIYLKDGSALAFRDNGFSVYQGENIPKEKKNVEMLTSLKIFSEAEIHSRYEICLENYCKTVNIEGLTMVDMARKEILPAVEAYLGDLSGTVAAKTAAVPGLACKYEKDLISKLSKLADEISDAASSLDTTLIRLKAIPDVTDAAYVIRDVVLQKMAELRVVCDEAESITADKYWPFPTYGDLLFGVR